MISLHAEDFGTYGLVVGAVSVINMMFINGSLQGVSKLVSETGAAKAVVLVARKIQLWVAGSVFVLFWVSAGNLANFLNDPLLVDPLRIASWIVLFYAFYAIHVGALNGLQRFKAQGLFDMIYASIKLALVLGLAYTLSTVHSAVLGFTIAAGVICIVAYLFVGRTLDDDQSAARISAKRLLYFQFTIMGFAFMINLVMNTDLFLVKKLMPPELANTHTGFYTAALTLSRIPYMVLISLNFILFPIISRRFSATTIPILIARNSRIKIRMHCKLRFGTK